MCSCHKHNERKYHKDPGPQTLQPTPGENQKHSTNDWKNSRTQESKYLQYEPDQPRYNGSLKVVALNSLTDQKVRI